VRAFLTAMTFVALCLAFCVDYARTEAVCPCGCGNPVHKHNPPRSTR
jgi:hypothetical protein